MKELVRKNMALGLRRDQALELAEITKDQFYYQAKEGKQGKPASKSTNYRTGERWKVVDNKEVVEKIKAQLSQTDLNYGYRKMSYFLQQSGYWINHKKVYRLMKEQGLLQAKKVQQRKNYVKYRIVVPNGPLEVLEMDIKQIWVEEHRRYAYNLTILDTFTRAALYFTVGYNMRQAQVKKAWEYVIEHHLQPADALRRKLHIEVRNDNGPQFSAKMIRKFFNDNGLHQVFTHPYTPQENGHVESFHGILAQHLKERTFWSLEHLEQDLTLFYERYNNTRIHASIAHLSPHNFWRLWEKKQIERIEKARNKVQFKLKIPYYLLEETFGFYEPKGSCLLQSEGLYALID